MTPEQSLRELPAFVGAAGVEPVGVPSAGRVSEPYMRGGQWHYKNDMGDEFRVVPPVRERVAGRWYCNTDNRWVGPNSVLGYGSENWNANEGTGAEPNVNWVDQGIPLDTGAVLHGMEVWGRSNNTTVTGFDLRLQQTSAAAAVWDGNGFDNNAEVTFSNVVSQNIDLVGGSAGNDMKRHFIDFPDVTITDPSTFRAVARPTGTITALRYIYATVFFIYTPPPYKTT